MKINRRAALRQLAIFSAGATLLPSCLGSHSKPDWVLRNFTVTGDQQETLDRLATTLIPASGTPGAAETGAMAFICKMADDCMSGKDQQTFFKGLEQLDIACRSTSGKRFADAGTAQREALLTSIGDKKVPGKELAFFYKTARRLAIQSYTTSPYFLTKVQVYELVPGRWHGCVPVTEHAASAS